MSMSQEVVMLRLYTYSSCVLHTLCMQHRLVVAYADGAVVFKLSCVSPFTTSECIVLKLYSAVALHPYKVQKQVEICM